MPVYCRSPVMPTLMLWLPVTYEAAPVTDSMCFGLRREFAPDNQPAMLRVEMTLGLSSRIPGRLVTARAAGRNDHATGSCETPASKSKRLVCGRVQCTWYTFVRMADRIAASGATKIDPSVLPCRYTSWSVPLLVQ